MNARENLRRSIKFETPEYIPTTFAINTSCWNNYDQNQLCDLIEEHPLLFPDYKRPVGVYKPNYPVNAIANSPYKDPWGCVWETSEDGITGSVPHHPLADWSDFENYKAPDPEQTDGTYLIDWTKIKKDIQTAKAMDNNTWGQLPHGHTFLRMLDIRGYENLLFDMVDETPNLFKLIDMVETFNYNYIRKLVKLEPDMIGFPEDLGMQFGPMLSPKQFKKYIKPTYQRLMKPVRDQGIMIHMHSDGDIRLLADDLIDSGVDIINLQDLVNGIDWIAEKFAGKICVNLDLDRQNITYSGSPGQIDALIREEVEKIGSKQGGLIMVYGLYPGVPIENITMIMDALERYSLFYS